MQRIDQIRALVTHTYASLDEGEYALVSTTRAMQAIIDKRHLTEVMRYRWFAVISRNDHVYAVADINGKRVSLQRLVLHLQNPSKPLEEIKQVSFENKNPFDCRFSNLLHRVGRQAVMRNRKKKRGSSSQYKGVRKATSEGRWRVSIKGDDGIVYLGQYDNERFAAAVYDAAAFQLFEGAAHYNLPKCDTNLDAVREATIRIERFRARQNTKQCKLD